MRRRTREITLRVSDDRPLDRVSPCRARRLLGPDLRGWDTTVQEDDRITAFGDIRVVMDKKSDL